MLLIRRVFCWIFLISVLIDDESLKKKKDKKYTFPLFPPVSSAGPDSRIWLGGAREGGAAGHEAIAQKTGGSVLCDEVKLGNTGT